MSDTFNGSSVDRHVGKRLRQAREALSAQPHQVAEGIGITPEHYLKCESGLCRISADILLKATRYLRIDILEMFKDFSVDEEEVDASLKSVIDLAQYRKKT